MLYVEHFHTYLNRIKLRLIDNLCDVIIDDVITVVFSDALSLR